jgi:hypothetical protein
MAQAGGGEGSGIEKVKSYVKNNQLSNIGEGFAYSKMQFSLYIVAK